MEKTWTAVGGWWVRNFGWKALADLFRTHQVAKWFLLTSVTLCLLLHLIAIIGYISFGYISYSPSYTEPGYPVHEDRPFETFYSPLHALFGILVILLHMMAGLIYVFLLSFRVVLIIWLSALFPFIHLLLSYKTMAV